MTRFMMRSRWSLADKCAALCSVVAVALYVASAYGGAIDGRIAPVVSPLMIDSIASHRDGVIVAGHATKRRDCDFAGLEWWLGDRGGPRVPVVARFMDPPAIRSLGHLEWRALLVGIRPDELNNSHADALHVCFGGMAPWVTRTEFWR